MKHWRRVIALFAVTATAVVLLVAPGVAVWLQALAGVWAVFAVVLVTYAVYRWDRELDLSDGERERISVENFELTETITGLRCQLWRAETELEALRGRQEEPRDGLIGPAIGSIEASSVSM